MRGVFALFLLILPGRGQAQEESGSHDRREVFEFDIGSCPKLWLQSCENFSGRTELAALGATAVTGITAWQFNDDISKEIQRHKNYRDFTSVGDTYGAAVDFGFAQFGFYLLGIGLKNDAVREFGILTTHSAILSGVFAVGLKLATNSPRPNGFSRGRFDSSFPSGHATGTAALAGTVQARYGTELALPFHLAALYTGLSRIVDNKHRPYEVVAGWGLGYATGLAVAGAWRKMKPESPAFSFLPWTGPGGAQGLSLEARFGGPQEASWRR